MCAPPLRYHATRCLIASTQLWLFCRHIGVKPVGLEIELALPSGSFDDGARGCDFFPSQGTDP
jgi:hypothetical protein